MTGSDISSKLQEWGLTRKKLGEDEGELAAKNLAKAVDALQESSTRPLQTKDKLAILSGMLMFQSLTGDDVRLQPMKNVLPTLCEIVKNTMLLPDDDENTEDYDVNGKQAVSKQIAENLNMLSITCAEFGIAAWEPVLKVLDAVSESGFKSPTPLKSKGAKIYRMQAASALVNTKPPWGSDSNPPACFADVMVKYLDKNMPRELLSAAGNTLSGIASSTPEILKGKYEAVFKGIEAGIEEMKSILIASYQSAYKSDPEAFHNNVELLMNKLDFMQAGAVLQVISDKNGKVLSPHVPALVAKLEKGVQYGMEIMLLTILNGIAKADPDAVYPYHERIYNAGIKVPNGDLQVVMVIANCGSASDPKSSEVVLIKLCEMLKNGGNLSPYSPPVILNGIVNQFSALEGKTSLLDPYMDTIKTYESSAGQIVEKIKDWHAGRSLEDISDRLEELEAKVAALNDEFSQQCKNWQDVEKMMESKIADLKEFVGEIVKKLPQPVELTVVGGVKKTLVLHFECAKTGERVTTETKQWSQWCKVGFGLIKLGKCAVATAATANVGALAEGVGAIRDIYGAYKSKDDSDFDTFIKQPFLTSAESDRLIEQLRDGGFFEKMGYDAQRGNWVLLEALDESEKAKHAEKAAEADKKAKNVSKQKGKNMGLGSIGDAAAAAIVASDTAGASYGGRTAGEVASGITQAKKDAKMVADVTNMKGKKKKKDKDTAQDKTKAKAKSKPSAGQNDNGSQQQTAMVVRKSSKPGILGRLFGFGRRASVGTNTRIEELERRIEVLEATVARLSS